MFGEMCCDEPFGIEIGGDIETVKTITPSNIYNFWKNMIETAPVIITVTGSQNPSKIFDQIKNKFQSVNRNPVPQTPTFSSKFIKTIKEKKETMSLAQGKLVMGFRSTVSSLEQDNLALRMMCDIWGGAPYSKLFTVVREQMSLCYYCAARLQSVKGYICVDSGVDAVNTEATKKGILEQLSAIQNGNFDNDIINASKMSLADSARSVTDSQSSIESWYLARLFDKIPLSPNEFIKNISCITKEDIIKAANCVSLDTVYTLCPLEDA